MSFKELHRTVKIRLFVQFMGSFASMMVIPFLAIYFSKRVGETITGGMFIVVLISGLIGGILGGHYADKIGRKKIMVLSELGVFLTYIIIAMFNSPWIEAPYVTFFLFIINLFFSGAFGPAAEAMLIDVSTPDERKMIYSLSYWSGNLATGVGGLLGAFLFEAYHFQLFILVATISLTSALITAFIIPETFKPTYTDKSQEASQPLKSKSKTSMFGSFGTALKDRPFLFYIIGGLLVLSVEQQLVNYIGIRLTKELPSQILFHFKFVSLHIDGIKMLGILRSENTFLVVLGGALVGKLMKRFLDRWVLIVGILVFTISFSFIGFSNSPWLLMLAMLIGTFGELMYVPIRQALIGDLAPDDARSTYIAINNLTYFGSSILGGAFITIGVFLNSYMMSGLFLLMGIMSAMIFTIIVPKIQDVNRHQTMQTEVDAGNI